MDKYIGQKKITTYNEIDSKIKYVLEDNSNDTVTHEQFKNMASDIAYDDAMVRVRKWVPAVRDIMGILLKNDLKIIDKDFVVGRVDETIVQNYAAAAAKLFGADYEHNISLSQIDRVLKSNNMKFEEEVSTPASDAEVTTPEENTTADGKTAEEAGVGSDLAEEAKAESAE